jgi:hypothetical protein
LSKIKVSFHPVWLSWLNIYIREVYCSEFTATLALKLVREGQAAMDIKNKMQKSTLSGVLII